MSHRRGIVALLSVVLLTLVPTFWRVAAAPSAGQPRAAHAMASQSAAPKINILGQGDVNSLPSSDDRLRLERITLPTLVNASEHTANGPEILAVDSGQVNITDNFGFSSTIDKNAGTMIAAGTSYQLANPGPDNATLLRFSIVAGTEGPVASPVVTASPAASPVASSSSVVADVQGETKVLLDQKIKGFPDGAAQIFLAKGTWDPGADSGALQHEGPIGIVVTEGTLGVASPSGLEGQLKAGRGAVLPPNVPLHASNKGNAQATALIFGVVSAKSALLATPVLVPTQTPLPTNTPVPTMAPSPTPTVAPTPTPSPTAVPTTKAGTILQLGETWQVNGAELTASLDQDQSDTYGGNVGVLLSYKNTTDQRVDFVLPDGLVRMYDDERNNWKWNSSEPKMTESRIILNPGETQKWKMHFFIPDGMSADTYSANVFVVFENFGAISSAEWGFTFNAGRILTLPPDAKDPTTKSSPGNTASSVANSSNTSGATAQTGALKAGQLAYSVKTGGHWDIWVHDFGKNQNIQLTTDPNSDQWAPAYSHDGSKLAYLSDASGSNQVWLMQPDGANQRQVSAWDGAMIRYVDWSSDDRTFYVTVQSDAAKQVMQMPVDGGDMTDLIPPSSNYVIAVPHRNAIYYVTDNETVPQIAVAPENAPTSGAVQFEGDSPTIGGNLLACQVGDKGGRKIVLRDLAGNVLATPPDTGDDSDPALTSNGAFLLWVADNGGPSQIEAWPTSGGNAATVAVAQNDEIWYIGWRPNS